MNSAEYEIEELAGKARSIFGVSPEVATVALKEAGHESATIDDARAIINTFLEREVK